MAADDDVERSRILVAGREKWSHDDSYRRSYIILSLRIVIHASPSIVSKGALMSSKGKRFLSLPCLLRARLHASSQAPSALSPSARSLSRTRSLTMSIKNPPARPLYRRLCLRFRLDRIQTTCTVAARLHTNCILVIAYRLHTHNCIQTSWLHFACSLLAFQLCGRSCLLELGCTVP